MDTGTYWGKWQINLKEAVKMAAVMWQSASVKQRLEDQ